MDWNQREMDWYYQALQKNEYPENIINYIEPILKKDYKMLDVGCGIGTFAQVLKEKVAEVIGIDHSEKMLNYLKTINKAEKKKIKVKTGDWNKLDLKSEKPINGLFTAYTGEEVVGNRSSILKMEEVVEDIIFLFVPTAREKHSFSTAELFAKLGRPKREHQICSLDLFKLLYELEINFQYRDFEYNFGQPFSDFKEAVDFFEFHYELKKNKRTILKSFLNDQLQQKDDYLWIDNFKKSTLFWWQPDSAEKKNLKKGVLDSAQNKKSIF